MFLLAACVPCSNFSQTSKHERQRESARVARVVYVALGDSTGVGVGAQQGGGYVERLFARIARHYKASRLVNLCQVSATSAEALREQVARAIAARPTLITVGIGANDLIQGAKAEEFARNYELIIRRLSEETNARIIITNIPDISLAPAVPDYMRDAARHHIVTYNKEIKSVARRYNLAVVDLFGRSREFASRGELFSADAIHPSDAGYEFWAELMRPIVEKAIIRRQR